MDNGGPVFPATHFDLADNEHGMTLRDYFAAQAIAGMSTEVPRNLVDDCAKTAYAMADAMLRAREVKP